LNSPKTCQDTPPQGHGRQIAIADQNAAALPAFQCLNVGVGGVGKTVGRGVRNDEVSPVLHHTCRVANLQKRERLVEVWIGNGALGLEVFHAQQYCELLILDAEWSERLASILRLKSGRSHHRLRILLRWRATCCEKQRGGKSTR
jgi:hypothetical protein